MWMSTDQDFTVHHRCPMYSQCLAGANFYNKPQSFLLSLRFCSSVSHTAYDAEYISICTYPFHPSFGWTSGLLYAGMTMLHFTIPSTLHINNVLQTSYQSHMIRNPYFRIIVFATSPSQNLYQHQDWHSRQLLFPPQLLILYIFYRYLRISQIQ
jgi:hypothetical protein